MCGLCKYLQLGEAFAKFKGECKCKDKLGVCFYNSHEMNACQYKNCNHPEWLKIKQEIEK